MSATPTQPETAACKVEAPPPGAGAGDEGSVPFSTSCRSSSSSSSMRYINFMGHDISRDNVMMKYGKVLEDILLNNNNDSGNAGGSNGAAGAGAGAGGVIVLSNEFDIPGWNQRLIAESDGVKMYKLIREGNNGYYKKDNNNDTTTAAAYDYDYVDA
ncbi:hypothetical protein FOL47_006996 [Perkinsus chesapeaki]|uniref:Uncharacterized protein n=1 Tax=Perkinsus chesapeaki TaxID=330153 RepID=A0A7J6N2Z8_PERCH|nr:hypothetical protein FOL47_006996 [Perkinsus chesapeaki]